MKKITDYNELAQVSQDSCVIEFGADWCGGCQMIKPTLKTLSDKYNLDLYEIDVNELSDVVSMFSITTLPITLVYLEGDCKARIEGNHSIKYLDEYFSKVVGD